MNHLAEYKGSQPWRNSAIKIEIDEENIIRIRNLYYMFTMKICLKVKKSPDKLLKVYIFRDHLLMLPFCMQLHAEM